MTALLVILALYIALNFLVGWYLLRLLVWPDRADDHDEDLS
jgi:hypothetical protein